MEGSISRAQLTSSAAAIHAFVLPTDFSSEPRIQTFPFSHPVLDFAILPSSQLLVTCDPAFGVFTQNQTGRPPAKGKAVERTVTPDQTTTTSDCVTVVQVGSGASVSWNSHWQMIIADVKLESTSSPLLTTITSLLADSANAVQPKILSALSLYPDLSLLPRWPGFEEDDDLAGSNEPVTDPSEQPAEADPAKQGEKAVPRTGTALYSKMAPSEAGTTGSAFKKDWTREELEGLGPRQLGRLKAQGVDVGDLLSRKRTKRDPSVQGKGKANGAGGKKSGLSGVTEAPESGDPAKDDESAMNA